MTFTDVSGGAVVGGHVLAPGADRPTPGAVVWSGSTISTVSDGADITPTSRLVDATDAWVLPGIVDLHGDAFERSLMPRAGVRVDLDVAFADNDVQLLAAGITTSFLAATDSWEPGLRSRATVRELIAALRRRRRTPRVELHVRHERCNTEDADELEEWIRTGAVGLLSFNDHTPGGIATVTGLTREQIERSGVDEATLEELLASAIDRRPTGLEQEPRLAAAAADAGCATASHDSHDDGNLRRDVELGVAIAEFPTSIELAHRYRRAGIDVSLGAPNLVRGGSHLGHMSVRDAVADGAGSLLCSDYHYPSLLHAPFVMSRLGLGSFGAAWTTVSEAPARAVGMADRGRLEPGAQADVVVVEPADDHTPARVRAVVVAGVVAYHAP